MLLIGRSWVMCVIVALNAMIGILNIARYSCASN
jgi:hypothetical protein